MIVFDFVAYKLYKFVVKHKKYEGAELMVTSVLLAMPVTIFVTVTLSVIENNFNYNFIDSIASRGKIPYLLAFTLPITLIIYIYLRVHLHKIEDKLIQYKILRILDKIPGYIIYFIFAMTMAFITVLISKMFDPVHGWK